MSQQGVESLPAYACRTCCCCCCCGGGPYQIPSSSKPCICPRGDSARPGVNSLNRTSPSSTLRAIEHSKRNSPTPGPSTRRPATGTCRPDQAIMAKARDISTSCSGKKVVTAVVVKGFSPRPIASTLLCDVTEESVPSATSDLSELSTDREVEEPVPLLPLSERS